MARFYPSGGAGGADTSVVTAGAGDILSGKVIVDADGNPLTGTLALVGDAAEGHVLVGKTFYNTDAKTKKTGTMIDQGAKTSSLNCGGSYTIPAGYHNGSGKITANSLSSQTDATATAAYIRSGYTAWVKGSKLTGTMAVTSAINFSATAQSDSIIRISWTNPSKGPWEGVEIRMSTSGSPGVSGGSQVYKGRGNNGTTGGASNYVDISGLSLGTTYYFTCTSYASGLGNGSSYNVSAKTLGMVLFDGSSLQNGCTWEYNNYRFDLTMTAGTLNGKKLVVIPKKNLSYYYLNPRIFDSNSSLHESYLKSDGTVQSLPKNATSSWTGGTKYTFNCNNIYGYDKCVRFRFAIGYTEAGTGDLTQCISLVALL